MIYLFAFWLTQVASAETIKRPNLPPLEIFRGEKPPGALVILMIPGKPTPTDRARASALAGPDRVIALLPVNEYETLHAGAKKCLYPAGELELLSKFIQAKYKFAAYAPPVIGALDPAASNLAFAALVQAPRGTFAHVSNLRAPKVATSSLSYCKGFALASRAEGNVRVMTSGARDMTDWRTFSDEDSWRASLTPPKPADASDIEGLPLTVVEAPDPRGEEMAVFLSGDGGWAEFDRELSARFAKAGIPVVGWSSLSYFWKARSPEEGAADLDRVIRFYSSKWKKNSVTVIGYSFGADVAPFFVNGLPAPTRAKVKNIVMLNASRTAQFEFHFTDWIANSEGSHDVAEELDKVATGITVQCLYAADEADDSVCPKAPKKVRSVKFEGGHHFGGDINGLFNSIRKPK